MVEGKTVFHVNSILDKKRRKSNGKLDATPAAQSPIQSCPECGSERLYRDGLRYLDDGETAQRWLCRDCGFRFSEHRTLFHEPSLGRITPIMTSQVCVLTKAKNLATARETETLADNERQTRSDLKGKLVEYLWHLKKQGYSEETVKTRVKLLTQLSKEGTNLFNPEDVKKAIAAHETWGNGHKLIVVHAYSGFVEMLGLKWVAPTYVNDKSLPFVPLEKEIDALISGCSKKISVSLQLLKETGMRIGEAWKLRWIDVDEEQSIIRCRAEKHGNPRVLKTSSKLISMVNSLPKTSEYVFANGNLSGHRWRFDRQKRKLAEKLQNPRLLQIKFHSLRHWKATMEYHKTKDILRVKQLLGHKRIDSTMVYTQLVSFEGDDYDVKATESKKEIEELLKVGFEWVGQDKDGLVFLRKRK